MFNGSSNLIIQGGTFIMVAGNVDRASLGAMGVKNSSTLESNHRERDNSNLSAPHGQEPCVGPAESGSYSAKNSITSEVKSRDSNANLCCIPHGQILTTDQISHGNTTQEEVNAQDSCKPQVNPAPLAEISGRSVRAPDRIPERGRYRTLVPSIKSEVKPWDLNSSNSNSSQEAIAQDTREPQLDTAPAERFGTSVHLSGRVPEYGPYPMPTPSMISTQRSSTASPTFKPVGATRRNASVSYTTPPPFPIPSSGKLQGTAYTLSHQPQKRHPTFPQPEHFLFGAGRQPCRPVRASKHPFSMPPPFPVPQLICGPAY